jgi:hypothetical protein
MPSRLYAALSAITGSDSLSDVRSGGASTISSRADRRSSPVARSSLVVHEPGGAHPSPVQGFFKRDHFLLMNYPDQTPLQQFILALVECGVAVVVLAILFLVLPRFLRKACRKVEQASCRFSERKTLAIFSVFAGVVVLRLAALPLLPVPVPGIHDEYSYLLLADTLAHGRLANPTHAMWISFETFHVNWAPTYSSMYPPAQGLLLLQDPLRRGAYRAVIEVGDVWVEKPVLQHRAAECGHLRIFAEKDGPGAVHSKIGTSRVLHPGANRLYRRRRSMSEVISSGSGASNAISRPSAGCRNVRRCACSA